MPRLLDFCCGAGGCSMGYYRVGFEVVGIDIDPQPNYPFEFIQADALEVLANDEPWVAGFDAFHASWPCQRFSGAQRIQGNEHPDLIGPGRELMEIYDKPYVIENVPGAPLLEPSLLCGTMFGLSLYRHRLFECNFPVTAPLHGEHWLPQVKMGRKRGPNEILQVVGNFSGADDAREAMGTPWMTRKEMAEAVPPAYTEHIGQYLMAELRARTAA